MEILNRRLELTRHRRFVRRMRTPRATKKSCGRGSGARFRLTEHIINRVILLSVIALLPKGALAQSQAAIVDCSAYHKNPDGLWTVTHENVIILDEKPLAIKMTMACCFASDSRRLVINGVNVINIVEKSCF